MAGDLEDFLRRAAQRRQQKVQQQKQQQAAPARREPPQYSDSRTERRVRSADSEEPVLTAELVEDDHRAHIRALRQTEDLAHAAKLAQQEEVQNQRRAERSKKKSPIVSAVSTGVPAKDLINMLRQPGGIQQAILLREILDRPEHRW